MTLLYHFYHELGRTRSFSLAKFCKLLFAGLSLSTPLAHGQENDTSDLVLLRALYDEFEAAVAAKDPDLLIPTYVDSATPLEIIVKGATSPSPSIRTAAGWANTLPGRSGTYVIEIGEEGSYTIQNNVATSIFPFEIYQNDSFRGQGVDLFLYVKTIDGWKIAMSSNTYVSSGSIDSISHASALNTPESVAAEMADAVNGRDADGFNALFMESNSLFMHWRNQQDNILDKTQDTSKAFSEILPDMAESVLFEISNMESEVADHYLAQLTADYSFRKSDHYVESGKLMITFALSSSRNWKITSAVRSETAPDDSVTFENLSTRGNAGQGLESMVAGFVVEGNGPTNVLVRAIGPGLNSLGATNTLEDPYLEVFDASGTLIHENDNWSSHPAAAAIQQAAEQEGAFGLEEGSSDATVLITVDPGVYTAKASSSDGTIGLSLIEVYPVD